MKIYVAGEGDSLRIIAKKYQIDLQKFIAINPYILNFDLNIAGICVKIPSDIISNRSQIHVTPCPPAESQEYLDHWIPLTSLDQMQETEYDVLIVGTGAGGGAVLWRLCEQWRRNGKRIGIIDSGDLLLPTHARNIPTMNNQRLERYLLNPKISKPIPQFPGAEQIYALGGRTLFWGAFAPRMHDSEMKLWPVTENEIRLYYNIAEQVMSVTQAYTKGSSIQEILLKRLWNNNFPEATDVPMAVDLERTKYGEIHSNVFFSSISFLAYALNRKPFDLAVKARATQIITEKGRAVGVKVMSPDKRSYFLKAKTIVLSASSYETPRLLLHSGIQGRAIGHYLMSHSFIRAKGVVSRKNFPEVLGALKILIPQTKERPYQIEVHGPQGYDWYQQYEEEPLQDQLEITLYGFGKVEPRFENKVTLDPHRRDEYGVPEININFSYSEQDKEIINRMAEAVKQSSLAMEVPLISNKGLPAICLQPPGEVFHDMGTCRIGDDPSTSATNRYSQIHGVSGLYVADSSVLLSVGAANPALTTVAFAIRTADHIIHNSEK